MIYVDELNSEPENGFPQVTCKCWSDLGYHELKDFLWNIGVFRVKRYQFDLGGDEPVDFVRLTPSQRERAISNNASYILFDEYIELRKKGYQYRLF